MDGTNYEMCRIHHTLGARARAARLGVGCASPITTEGCVYQSYQRSEEGLVEEKTNRR